MSFRNVTRSGANLLAQCDSRGWGWYIVKKWNMGLVYTACKLFMKGHKVDFQGLDNLLEAQKQARLEGRGLVTVMNHTSVLDDPVVWGQLPYDNGWIPWLVRWGTGAADICYKNALNRTFFRAGQVMPIKRFGGGPFQPGIDMCVKLLSPEPELKYTAANKPYLVHTHPTSYPFWRQSQWIHMFPEGYVHQALAPFHGTMRYFRWGTSRVILEPSRPPLVVPMYSYGLQAVFPEIKGVLPKPDKVIFKVGQPLDDDVIARYRQEWLDLCAKEGAEGGSEDMPESLKTGDEAQELRSRLAGLLRSSVEKLRMEIPGMEPELPEFGEAEFWKDMDAFAKGTYVHNGKVSMLKHPTKGLLEAVEKKSAL